MILATAIQSTGLDPAAVAHLAAALRGAVITPRDPSYDAARAVYFRVNQNISPGA